jgi:predicted N-acetyltransferase YhbS
MIVIGPEPPDAAPRREALLDRAFGFGRFAKTAERLREGRLPANGLSFAAIEDDSIVGTIRFWHVRIGQSRDALLLGPVAVAESHHGQGIGAALIRRGLRAAKARGHAAVILVGDERYYCRFGFRMDLTWRLELPGWVDRSRFLGIELISRGLAGARGLIRPTGPLEYAPRKQAA